MISLKLVTFELDLTQFLVEAVTDDEAIVKAIEANLKLGEIDGGKEEILDHTTYTVKDVDVATLYNLLVGKDVVNNFDGVITFMS